MAATYTFKSNPFALRTRAIDPMIWGASGDSNYFQGGMPRPTEESFWEMTPEFANENAWQYENWLNPDNMQVVGTDPEGNVQFQVKTGDKEGTLYTLRPTEGGGYVAAPESTHRWDTNDQLSKWGPAIPLLAFGAATGLGGLLGGTPGTGAAGTGATGLSGMTASDAALLAGGEPIAGSGFSLASSGTPAFGQAFTPAATLAQAGEAAGSIGGLSNLAGAGSGASSALTTLGNTASKAGVVKSVADALGLSEGVVEGALKLLPTAAAAALGYADAKSQEDKTTGYEPSTTFLTEQMRRNPVTVGPQITGLLGAGPNLSPPVQFARTADSLYRPQFSSAPMYQPKFSSLLGR